MSIKWGTDSKVQYIEPTYGFPISIGASGEMSLRVEDSRKLLIKLVGAERDLSQQKLVGFFRAFLMTRVKTYIAQVMKTNAINIFEIDENLTMFSENIHKLLIPDFLGYGVSLERFFVTNIARPDGDRQYEKFKELHFRQYADIAEAKLRQQTGLKSINIPSGAKSIGESAFNGCKGLAVVTFSEGIESIGDMAFYNCTKLTMITIPSSVNTIGICAFSTCTNLRSVRFMDITGWRYANGQQFSVILSNAQTAAKYLTETYRYYRWTKN